MSRLNRNRGCAVVHQLRPSIHPSIQPSHPVGEGLFVVVAYPPKARPDTFDQCGRNRRQAVNRSTAQGTLHPRSEPSGLIVRWIDFDFSAASNLALLRLPKTHRFFVPPHIPIDRHLINQASKNAGSGHALGRAAGWVHAGGARWHGAGGGRHERGAGRGAQGAGTFQRREGVWVRGGRGVRVWCPMRVWMV